MKSKDDNQTHTPEAIYKKSNMLINSQHKGSLMMNKIMALSFANSENFYIGKHGTIVSEISVSELTRAFGRTGGAFYKELDKAASGMTGYTIGTHNDEAQEFSYKALIIEATFKNKKLSIYYNADFKDELMDIGARYTRLRLETMMSFRSVYSLRLYENLRSYCYPGSRAECDHGEHYHLVFSVGELKLILGVVDGRDDKVQAELRKKNGPVDYDYAVSLAREQRYASWRDFQSKVLAPAVEEINQITSKHPDTGIHVEYGVKRTGRGGKISEVIFDIKKTTQDASVKDEQEQQDRAKNEEAIFNYLLRNVDHLDYTDLKNIAKAAEYDKSRVEKAVEVLHNTSGVDSIVGFLIKAIKEDYRPPIKGGKKTNRDFENKQEYDFNELEETLIEKPEDNANV